MICTQANLIREIDEQRWNTAAGNLSLMAHRSLRVLESCWREYTPRYLLLENDQGPCLAAVANTRDAFKNRGLMRWLYRHLVLVFRSPYNTECGVAVHADHSLAALMPELLPVMERLCRKERRLFMAVSNVCATDLPLWQQAGFLTAPQRSTNIIDVPATYELYLGTLRPKYRSELLRIRRRAAEAGVRLEVSPLSEEEVAPIYSLFGEVHEKHGVSTEEIPFSSQFLTELCRHIPEQTLVVRGFVENQLSGAFLCACDGVTLWSQVAGLSYERSRPTQLYFLMIDEMIRWSIEHGIRQIYAGFSNDQLKQRQGFRTEERWICYRAALQPLNRLLALALPLARRLIQRSKRTH